MAIDSAEIASGMQKNCNASVLFNVTLIKYVLVLLFGALISTIEDKNASCYVYLRF